MPGAHAVQIQWNSLPAPDTAHSRRRALQEAEVVHQNTDTLLQTSTADRPDQAGADGINVKGGGTASKADDIDAVRQARRERALQAQQMHEAEAAAAETSSEEETVCA
jgi:hypothetical protein